MKYSELRSEDLRRLIDFTAEMNACSDLIAIEAFFHSQLRFLVDGDVTVWNEVISTGEIGYASCYPDFGESFWNRMAPAIASNIHEHPFIVECIQSRPELHTSRLSDYSSYQRFVKSELYNEPYKEWGCKHICIGAIHTGEDSHLAFQINRSSRDFSLKELQTFQALMPHLAVAHRRLRDQDRLEREIAAYNIEQDSLSAFWLSLGSSLHVKNASANARLALRSLFDAKLEFGFQLPQSLQDALWREIERWRTQGTPLNARKVDFDWTAGRPQCHFEFSQLKEFNFWLKGILKNATILAPTNEVESAKLSNRELVVLHWTCEGKTNPEIAMILGLRPKTVEKHLSSVFDKLGISNRRSLIATLGHSNRSNPKK